MKSLTISMILLWSLISLAGSFANQDKTGLMLTGYDPVSYFQAAKPLKGNAKITAKIEDRVYWFASEENKKLFVADPVKYEPQFGGWCAYAVADSKSKVDVDPNNFSIQDGKLLLFYNGLWGDTKKKWSTNKDKDAKTYLIEANANWHEVKNKEP